MSSHSAKSPQPIVSHLKTSWRGKEGAGERAFPLRSSRQPGISVAVPGKIRAGRGDELTNAGGDGEGVGERASRHADERLLPRIPGHFSRLVAFSYKTGRFSYKTSRFSSKNWLRIFAVVNFVSVVQLLHVLNQLHDH